MDTTPFATEAAKALPRYQKAVKKASDGVRFDDLCANCNGTHKTENGETCPSCGGHSLPAPKEQN